jgi:hypothetical protein
VVSTGQLAAGVAGLVVALRRKRAYDFLGIRGEPAHVARDATWMGTALSAPMAMLVAQAWATLRIARPGSHPRARTRAVLGGLGVVMVVGYLGESLVRRRLRTAGWDRVESPIAGAGLALAVAMVVLATEQELNC